VNELLKLSCNVNECWPLPRADDAALVDAPVELHDDLARPVVRVLHSFPNPLNLSLLCPPYNPTPLVDVSRAQVGLECERSVLKVLKWSFGVSECMPLPVVVDVLKLVDVTVLQGLTLVHISAQCKHFL